MKNTFKAQFNEIVIFFVACIVMSSFYAIESKYDHLQLYNTFSEFLIPFAIGLLMIFELKSKFRVIFALVALILGFCYEFYQLPEPCSNKQYLASIDRYRSIEFDDLENNQTFIKLLEGVKMAPPYPDMIEEDYYYFARNLYAEYKSLDLLCTE
ncbi:hypothetical protein [Enterovibrio norvegicus]|uniref:Uncharacterized protein n=1 Tax=Enterovibrio norvegicus TaxID=188144 RepID=A0A2N7L460_9GAMM|nr:hypothetical protein [Enterovibrio norvegicus]PMN88182.1 hypothetical protein BCT23_07085 [Enterovibrio norvegicus]